MTVTRLAQAVGLAASLAGCGWYTNPDTTRLLEELVIQQRQEIFTEEEQLAAPPAVSPVVAAPRVGCPVPLVRRR